MGSISIPLSESRLVLTMLQHLFAPFLVSLVVITASTNAQEELNQLLWMNSDGEVKLIDLSDPSAAACDLPAYPDGVPPVALTYSDIFDYAFACGAHADKDKKTCYAFDGSVWQPLENGVLVGDHYPFVYGTYNHMMPGLGWWIGGTKSSEANWNSELYTENREWVSLPLGSPYPGDAGFLPGRMCSVKLNSTHILLTGGIEEYFHTSYKEIWILDLESLVWSKSTPMLGNGRSSHACGLNSAGELVIVGGWESNNIVLDSVQILNLESGEWREAGTVPEGVDTNYPVMLTWQDQLIMLSRDTGDIWMMADDGSSWTPAAASLSGTFFGGYDVVTLVSDKFRNGCM